MRLHQLVAILRCLKVLRVDGHHLEYGGTGVSRHQDHGRDAPIDRKRQFLDQLLIGYDLVLSRWQYSIDTFEFEWMAEDNKCVAGARDHWN